MVFVLLRYRVIGELMYGHDSRIDFYLKEKSLEYELFEIEPRIQLKFAELLLMVMCDHCARTQ